jgi:hypothetical protein
MAMFLAACGPGDASVTSGDPDDKDVGVSTSKALNVGSGEYYPAPFASLSLSGISASAPRTSTFSYHPTSATTPSDRYRVINLPSAPIGHALEITVDSTPDGETDPVITVVDRLFTQVGSDDDSGPGSNSLLRYTFTDAAAGPFALLVREYGHKAGTFRLTVKDLSAPGGPTTTDTVLNAAEGLTQSAILGNLPIPSVRSATYRSPPNLRAYSLYLTAGQKIDVQVSSTSGDAYAFLFAPSPSYALLIKDDDSGGNRNSHFTYTVAQTGTHYLGFRDYNLHEATFEVRVSSGTQPLPSVPSAPTSVSATAGTNTGTARVAYEVPYSTEFTMVSACRAEDSSTGAQFNWSLSYNLDWNSSSRLISKEIANLAAGTHSFKVQCLNATGWGPWSLWSGSVTVTGGNNGSGVPAAPTAVTINRFQPGNGGPVQLPQLVIYFTPGASPNSLMSQCEGSDTLQNRTYSWHQEYFSSSSNAFVYANDINTGDHAFRVRCSNSQGWGPWSATTATFHVGVLNTPVAPSTPSVTAYSWDPGNLRLSFSISDYYASSISACKAQDVNTQNIVMLTSVSSSNYSTVTAAVGTHAFRIACQNANGWGPWSAASNAVVVQ